MSGSDDFHEHTFVTALSFLPWQLCASIECQDQHQHLTALGHHGNTMDLLDALAAMCVCRSFETYSTALVLQQNEVTLLVSSSVAVSDVVERRLQSIWQFMRMLHDHQDTVQLRHSDMSRIVLRKLALDFAVDQYRYSLPALRARLAHDAVIVVDCIRAFLGCHAPHTAYVSTILKETWQEHDALSDSERRLLHNLMTDLEAMQSAVAPPEICDEAILELLRRMQEQNRRMEAFLPGNETMFTRMEAICTIPVRYHIRRILWLADPCVVVPAYAISLHFRPFAKMHLRIHIVPSVRTSTLPRCDPDRLRSFALVFYPEKHRDAFEDDFRACLVQAFRPGDAVNSGPEIVGDYQLHDEMALLQHLDAHSLRPISYIGHSEQCCLPCHLFLRAYTLRSSRYELHVRGTHGRTLFPWLPPRLSCITSGYVHLTFYTSLAIHFDAAWRIVAYARRSERGALS